MRDHKYRFETYPFYDPDGIRRHLEAMARKGWLLDGIFLAVWRYRRIEPKALPFTVVYDPDTDPFAPDPTPDDPLCALCAHSGWTLAAASGFLQIYYSRQPHPVPLETDPVVTVENIHRMAKRTLLPSCGLFLGLALLDLALELNNLFTTTLDFLSSGMDLILLLFGIVILPLSVGGLAMYYAWRKKALAAAELGQFLPPKHRPWANALLWLTAPLLLCGYFAFGITVQNRYDFFRWTAVILLCALVEEIMRKKRAHRDTTQNVALLLCIVLSVSLAVFEGAGVIDKLDREYSLHGWQAHPPLVLADFGIAAAEHSRFTTGDSSPLLAQLTLAESPAQVYETNFRYHITQVKHPALYALCREKALEGHNWEAVPAQGWGAQQAYRSTDQGDHYYLLCYPEVIVGIGLPWPPTPAQTALVGARLGAIQI